MVFILFPAVLKDARVRELNVLSMCFLHPETPKSKAVSIAFLHRDHTRKTVLVAHDLVTTELDLSTSPSTILPETTLPDSNYYQLIPVPPNAAVPQGGVLVLGEDRISLYPNNKKRKKRSAEHRLDGDRTSAMQAGVPWPYSEVTA